MIDPVLHAQALVDADNLIPRSSLPPSSPPSSPIKPSRLRATVENPCFGLVDGAGRGGNVWGMSPSLIMALFIIHFNYLAFPRDRPLPLPITSVAKSTKRYNRELANIICRVCSYLF